MIEKMARLSKPAAESQLVPPQAGDSAERLNYLKHHWCVAAVQYFFIPFFDNVEGVFFF